MDKNKQFGSKLNNIMAFGWMGVSFICIIGFYVVYMLMDAMTYGSNTYINSDNLVRNVFYSYVIVLLLNVYSLMKKNEPRHDKMKLCYNLVLADVLIYESYVFIKLAVMLVQVPVLFIVCLIPLIATIVYMFYTIGYVIYIICKLSKDVSNYSNIRYKLGTYDIFCIGLSISASIHYFLFGVYIYGKATLSSCVGVSLKIFGVTCLIFAISALISKIKTAHMKMLAMDSCMLFIETIVLISKTYDKYIRSIEFPQYNDITLFSLVDTYWFNLLALLFIGIHVIVVIHNMYKAVHGETYYD